MSFTSTNITSTAANSTNPIICALDNRRSSKELWVKLFVVHLTTIAAFCHILSVRREPIISWKLVFYILVPYSIFAYLAFAFSAILIALVHLLVITLQNKPTEEARLSLWRAPKWLLGKVSDPTDAYQQLPMTATTLPPQTAEQQTGWKKVGRILLALPFLAQCIGTIVLYARRQSHHAVTLADQRVFELGCTGVVTAIYWLADTIGLPPFSQPTPTVDDATSGLDKTLLILRDCQVKPLILKDDDAPRLVSFFKNGAICFIVLLVERKIRPWRLVWAIFTLTPVTDEDIKAFDMIFVFMGICLGAGLSIAACCGGTLRSKASMRKSLGSRKKDDRPWWLFCCYPVGLAVLWLPAIIALGGFLVLVMAPIEWTSIGQQIHELDVWPTNATCPLLWSDPAANWIWALA